DVMRALHEAQRVAMRAQARRLRRALGRGGSGLEVGSYVGAFLRAARDDELNVEGLDVNRTANDFARSMGFTVHDGDLASFDASRRFDCIAIWNTFDQLAEPRAALRTAHALLRPQGVLAIRVPNGAAYATLSRRMRRSRGPMRWAARALLAHNNLLAFPYRAGFSPDSLRALLSDVGFEVFNLRGDVLVPTSDEWTRPWARVEERIVKRLLGLSARRHAAHAPWFEAYARRLG
ncbi:MAG: class I SAM-dependent methyltransferase, partial [Gemmatimonadales bacterium]